jgi:hypothetical protein
MKTSIFLAVLLAGAAVATSKAEGAFAINLENGGRSASSSHPSGQYREPVVDNRYEAHEALHGQLDAERSVLDYKISAQHEAWHQEWDRQHKALHRELDRERAMGATRWQVQAQHEAWHRQSSAQHAAEHEALRRGHVAGRLDIHQQHEIAHP